jgi:hypothetical protein
MISEPHTNVGSSDKPEAGSYSPPASSPSTAPLAPGGKGKSVRYLLAENKLLYAEMARLPNRQAAEAFGRVREGLADIEVEECIAHDSGPILWPGTAHQGTVCRRCGAWLPC